MMNKLFTKRTASYCILITLSLIVLFHLLVLVSIVPFQIVWGGRLTNHSQMVRFEMISIAINLIMLAVVAIHTGILKLRIKPLLIYIVLWCMGGLFLLNTIGNLLSINTFEKMVFTPLTLLLSICCFRLALDKQ
ncbi:hypothetical protein SY85_19470 [Flavisolibacter tropicus]|uniref:Uncharacterized protein n=2 Tax=Flavisolibacter tropicus TaxID=1492898 RepID=A0A172TZD3_9BACT|nr:hypothetical protein SY85_19470 [Flavisolibacter tropicus]